MVTSPNIFTINRLIHELEAMDSALPVYFDFCRAVPTVIDSWRGIYAEPALGFKMTGYSGGVDQAIPTVGELISNLKNALTGTYQGWKGGEYQYNGDEPLHIDNPGDCTYTQVADIERLDDWMVVIRTKMERE